nr:winged helix-turn-helix domain-containing protein [uncultured Dyadobacter sp.]
MRNSNLVLALMGLWGLLLGPGIIAMANNDAVRFSEHVNLALRRTAHRLLIANGDSLSQIPPVKQTDAHTFSVQMQHMFDYDKLPETLQESLQMHRVKLSYNVMVTRCENSEVVLGYQLMDLTQPGGVPCRSRAHEDGCYILQVRFTPETTVPKSAGSNWIFLSLGVTAAGLGFIVWSRSRNKKTHQPIAQAVSGPTPRLTFGGSWLDITNQTLHTGTAMQALTYRETKLLALFARNTNQVLERDTILKSVWEDEGVTVGRSVDVFVSRLRKMLVPDPLIKISAIHGVGYKMEVHS